MTPLLYFAFFKMGVPELGLIAVLLGVILFLRFRDL
jgi:hypothetical protein